MGDTARINDIVRTVKEHWIAVTPGYDCACGHQHHGRELYRNGRMENLAPQYGFCDDDTCVCSSLKRVAV